MVAVDYDTLVRNCGYKSFLDMTVHPAKLDAKDIDEELQTAVFDINNSGWIYTLFCCTGHWRGAYYYFITHEANKEPIVALLAKSTYIHTKSKRPKRERIRQVPYRLECSNEGSFTITALIHYDPRSNSDNKWVVKSMQTLATLIKEHKCQ